MQLLKAFKHLSKTGFIQYGLRALLQRLRRVLSGSGELQVHGELCASECGTSFCHRRSTDVDCLNSYSSNCCRNTYCLQHGSTVCKAGMGRYEVTTVSDLLKKILCFGGTTVFTKIT